MKQPRRNNAIPREIRQPGRHVFETQMFHLNVRVVESLDTFFKELQRQMRFVLRESLADGLDEDRVVRRNAKTWPRNI